MHRAFRGSEGSLTTDNAPAVAAKRRFSKPWGIAWGAVLGASRTENAGRAGCRPWLTARLPTPGPDPKLGSPLEPFRRPPRRMRGVARGRSVLAPLPARMRSSRVRPCLTALAIVLLGVIAAPASGD